MDKQQFEQLKTAGKLPSPSGVALRLLELCRRDDVALTDITRVLRADPALSGRLIRFANSALASPRRHVASIDDAARMLGTTTVRQLALGFSTMDGHRDGACKAFDYPGFWSRSLATGLAAQVLAEHTRAAPTEEMFTCGLLARVGELGLASLYPDAYGEVLAAPEAERRALERQRLGADHVELGVALLEDWMLPAIFVEVLAHLDDPKAAPWPTDSRERRICQLLHLACGIGDLCAHEAQDRRQHVANLLLEAEPMGIGAAAFRALADEVVTQWREWGPVLQIQTGYVPPMDVLLPELGEAASAGDPGGATSAGPADDTLGILVVDDDAVVRTLVSRLLREQGHRVSTARDGREALAVAMRELPQMIVSDWMMPEMDGITFCRTLRGTREGRQIYFLLLTSLEQEDNLVQAFESGVDDFMNKPVSARVLMARLRAGLRVIRLQQEAERDSQSLRRFATELSVANRRLQQAALTDPLTGLPNRRYAMERMEQEWAASTRSHRPFTVMMIDVDRFKLVNDTYGHETGDVALRQVAGAIRRAARSEDVICRIGGEEFLVISPDTAAEPSLRLAERLRQAVAGTPLDVSGKAHPLSVCVGVAQRTEGMTRFDEVLKAADEALYRGKRLGGDKVVAADTGGEPAIPPADGRGPGRSGARQRS